MLPSTSDTTTPPSSPPQSCLSVFNSKVKSQLQRMSRNKAAGSDGISSRALKASRYSAAPSQPPPEAGEGPSAVEDLLPFSSKQKVNSNFTYRPETCSLDATVLGGAGKTGSDPHQTAGVHISWASAFCLQQGGWCQGCYRLLAAASPFSTR